MALPRALSLRDRARAHPSAGSCRRTRSRLRGRTRSAPHARAVRRRPGREVVRGVHAAHHVDDVDAPDRRAELRDLVRERDHRREQRVRRVLDHLRRARVACRSAGSPAEGRVQLVEARACVRSSMPPSTMRSGDMKSATAWPSVRNSGFMPRPKSRPACRPEAASSASRTTPVGRAGDDRALHHHDVVARPCARAPRRSHAAAATTAERSIPPSVERRADGDQRDVGRRARALARSVVARSRPPTLRARSSLRPGLVDRRLARVDLRDLRRVEIDARRRRGPCSARHTPVTSPT